jgi:hypothetical protein
MLEQKTVTVDGREYLLFQLGAKSGRKVMVRLTKVLGGAAGELAQGEGFDEETIARFIRSVAQQLNEVDFEYVCDIFAKSTRVVEGERQPMLSDVFDEHFAGRYYGMVKWLGECLAFNFSDFLGGSGPGSLLAGLAGKGPASPSPKSSTGSSGE